MPPHARRRSKAVIATYLLDIDSFLAKARLLMLEDVNSFARRGCRCNKASPLVSHGV